MSDVMQVTQQEQKPVETPLPEKPHEDPLRVAVATAFDASEKKAQAAAPKEPPAKLPLVLVKDPKTGRFQKKSDDAGTQVPAPKGLVAAAAPPAPGAAAPATPAKPAAEKPEGEEQEAGRQPARADRAPQSWKPEARALWAKLPPEFVPVKAEVVRLERERETVLRESSSARQLSSTFMEVVRPYEGFIRAAGHTPMQSVAELMKTAAALRTLPDWDRAVLVAGIARAHGVNPEYLFAALSGQGPLPGVAAAQPQQEFRDPRVDDLLARADEAAEAHRATADRAADDELDQFIAANPLADDPDVQARLATAIDLAKATSGVDITYEEAYSGVLAVDPELRAIAEQQAEAAATTPDAGATARAEAAASSLKPSPVTTAPLTLRGQPLEKHVEAAFEKVAGRRA